MATSLTLQNDPSSPQGYLKVNGTTAATVTENGLSMPQATIGSINGILKATNGVVSQAVAGTDYLTSSSGGAITLDTAKTASGTAVDFTGIPSWAKRITVMLSGISCATAPNSTLLLQLGTSSGIQSTGYLAGGGFTGPTSSGVNSTIGFPIGGGIASVNLVHGIFVFNYFGSNKWVGSFSGAFSDDTYAYTSGGSTTLSGVLDRLRITTVAGTTSFDAGTINISYEG